MDTLIYIFGRGVVWLVAGAAAGLGRATGPRGRRAGFSGSMAGTGTWR